MMVLLITEININTLQIMINNINLVGKSIVDAYTYVQSHLVLTKWYKPIVNVNQAHCTNLYTLQAVRANTLKGCYIKIQQSVDFD